MKKIFLTQGQFALVDDAEYEWLNQFNWYAHYNVANDSYYAVRHETLPSKKRIIIAMHRFILGLNYGDKRQGDHIHHDTLDNRRSELRIVTHRQNKLNCKIKRSSKYDGVTWDESRCKWRARIHINKKQKTLGRYDIEKDAGDAYQGALNELESMKASKADFKACGA